MSNKINVPDRPESIALMTAIEDAIEEIAPGKLTHYEVLGVLDAAGKRFYENTLSTIKMALDDHGIYE